MTTRQGRRRDHAPSVEDVEARAERLGITVERVLREYASLAFADLRRIADWGPGEDGLRINPSEKLAPADAAAIAEIVASAATGRIYRIKLHDKTPVLGALARHLHMLKTGPHDDEKTDDETGESARQLLIREFDRLEAEAAAGPGVPEPGE